MGLFDDARKAHGTTSGDADNSPTPQGASTATATTSREIETTVGGEIVTVEDPETIQPTDDGGTWLTGTDGYGRPRGIDAVENRQIVQTSAMQSIVNGIAGQVLGGELTFNADDAAMDDLGPAGEDAAENLRTILRDVLTGPHLPNRSLDQLIVAAIEDMVGPGQAVWQLLESENGSVPVVAMQTLDPLTIRMNIDENNVFGDPPYWQAQSPVSGGQLSNLGGADPTPLQHDQIAVLDYPYGTRSYRTYPISPAWQVKEWLEILANSTTHHNRFYSDSEIPPGLLQIINASPQTVDDVKEKIQDASGDPRDVPIIGGEGGAAWLDMGGTAVNLNIIEEQKWFFHMCLGALGLGKAEVGLIEDVNRSNGEVEATRVYKRVAGPFINQFEHAFLKVARQFDAFNELGEPFTPTLSFTDPREERAKEKRLREQLQSGAITPIQYARRTGDQEVAEDADEWTIELAGETINYGEHPMWVTKRLMSAAAGDGVDTDGAPDGENEGDGGE
jgi:hypothetical protein